MKKNNNDYYSKMRELSELIFDNYNLFKFINYNNEYEKELLYKIYIEKFYNILLDIINQEIYDNIKEFSNDDVEFIINFEIDKILPDIIKAVYEKINIKKIKRKLKKS